MKRKFLAIVLAVATSVSLVIPAGAATQTSGSRMEQAGTEKSIEEKLSDLGIRFDGAISLSGLVEKLETVREGKKEAYFPENTEDGAMLMWNGDFLKGKGMVDAVISNGGYVVWLYPEEEEILRQTFTSLFSDLPSPVGVDSGMDEMTGNVTDYMCFVNYAEDGTATPDWDKIIITLIRGTYSVSLDAKMQIKNRTTGKIYTNNPTIKAGQKYQLIADYTSRSSDGKDYPLGNLSLNVDYDKKKPAQIKVSLYGNPAEDGVQKTIRLNVSKALQKKIKNGKVVFSASSAYKNSHEKSGQITLNFTFKTKKQKV